MFDHVVSFYSDESELFETPKVIGEVHEDV